MHMQLIFLTGRGVASELPQDERCQARQREAEGKDQNLRFRDGGGNLEATDGAETDESSTSHLSSRHMRDRAAGEPACDQLQLSLLYRAGRELLLPAIDVIPYPVTAAFCRNG